MQFSFRIHYSAILSRDTALYKVISLIYFKSFNLVYSNLSSPILVISWGACLGSVIHVPVTAFICPLCLVPPPTLVTGRLPEQLVDATPPEQLMQPNTSQCLQHSTHGQVSEPPSNARAVLHTLRGVL